MKRALERHNAGQAHVIPVILRPVMWKETPLGELQALPQDGKPVIQWPHPDMALENVAQGVSGVVTTLLAKLEQEAIRLQKIEELEIDLRSERAKLYELRRYQNDLGHTIQFKRLIEEELLEQLGAVREEINLLYNLEKATKDEIALSVLNEEILLKEHRRYERTLGEIFFGVSPQYVYPAPKLLEPPFKPESKQG